MDEILQIKHALVLKEAKNVFNKVIKEDPIMEGLYMIDAIQRLSIDHLFKEEIQKTLLKQTSIISDFANHLHLSQVALQFRLLRQAGLCAHADIFVNFKDKQGELKEEYREDIKGLVALYEASQLSIEGEDSLDDTGRLSRQLLETWLSKHEDHHEAQVVANALENPLHQSLSRFTNRNIILSSSVVLIRSKRRASFLELAEINFCMISHLNQNELFQVSQWWKEVEVGMEMKFGRMKAVKWYMWPMACLTDPKFSKQRIQLTKSVSLVYIIDDIFDVYGSLDDLTCFTDAVNRWDSTDTVQLPDYMKSCFNLLHNTINELAAKVQLKHGLNPTNTLKKSWAALVNSFLVEARWLNSGELPKAKEYLENGIVSSGVHVVFLHAFFLLLDQNITQQNIAVMDQIPSLSSLVGKILRLCDDLEGDKSDDQNGLDGSYLVCYTKENDGVSVEDAQTHVAHLISNAWKRLNQETLITPSPFPPSFTEFCLNASRMVLLMYSYRRNQSLLNLQEYLKSLLRVDKATYEHIHIPSNPKGQMLS
ncbi:hypothetical protein QN277_009463 [Acacia crassicarpa]|uniref:S-linalool synthase n=1 Tax=Acacia crassicarpa TaxID=499986 RepID=A0AAE1JM66_9FABA|nr:hypothetical protein QN277_009463 [Acacia crassicarpa]